MKPINFPWIIVFEDICPISGEEAPLLKKAAPIPMLFVNQQVACCHLHDNGE